MGTVYHFAIYLCARELSFSENTHPGDWSQQAEGNYIIPEHEIFEWMNEGFEVTKSAVLLPPVGGGLLLSEHRAFARTTRALLFPLMVESEIRPVVINAHATHHTDYRI